MNKALRPLLAASTATLALALPLPAEAAVDAFLKLDGIPGEVIAKGHENEIEVFSWSFGIARTSVVSMGRATASKPCVSDIHVMKMMDKATPLLMANLMSGMVIPKGKLTLRKAGGDASSMDFMVIEMSQVLVSSVQESGSSGGDMPMESISLNFASAKATYTPQRADGTPGTPIPANIQGGGC